MERSTKASGLQVHFPDLQTHLVRWEARMEDLAIKSDTRDATQAKNAKQAKQGQAVEIRCC